MKERTQIIHTSDEETSRELRKIRMVNSPIYSGSTVLLENYEDLMRANAGTYAGVVYGTDRLPNQRELEEALRSLEGGHLTRAFQSGLSAITNTLLAFTKSGDHILVCDNVYGPNAKFCKKILAKYNVEVTFLPSDIGHEVELYIRPETRLIFLESPGSNTFEIQDISAITSIAEKKGIITVLDNTWATPLYLNPFSLGVDVSIQSVTKYISGHSDVLLGTVTVNEKWAEEFSDYYKTMEIFASSQECYLALRGLKTLPVRLRQHEKSALHIAKWLESIDVVEKVIHPALTSHPQHHLWQKYFTGSTGLFAFTFKENITDKHVARWINSLTLFGIGYSWGGYESLVTAGKYPRYSESEYDEKTIIRLNIGLEDKVDLQMDLEKAFAVLSD